MASGVFRTYFSPAFTTVPVNGWDCADEAEAALLSWPVLGVAELCAPELGEAELCASGLGDAELGEVELGCCCVAELDELVELD